MRTGYLNLLTEKLSPILKCFQLREQTDGREFPLGSWIKVCPLCHEVWATLSVGQPRSLDPLSKWYSVHAVPCAECWEYHDRRNIPGSLLFDTSAQRTDWDLLSDLPLDLVTREVLLHIKAYEHTYPECGFDSKLTSNTAWYLPDGVAETLTTIDTRTGQLGFPSGALSPPGSKGPA